MNASIAKWGNSLALRLPRNLAADARMMEGTPVTLTVEGGRLIVTPSRPKYRLSDLLAQVTPENRHEEADWGGPRGSEAW